MKSPQVNHSSLYHYTSIFSWQQQQQHKNKINKKNWFFFSLAKKVENWKSYGYIIMNMSISISINNNMNWYIIAVSCTMWEKRDVKKADLSVLDISSAIIGRVEQIPDNMDYFYTGKS